VPRGSTGAGESRLEGVDRRNLKFTNLSTQYKSGLALELKPSPKEREKTNHPRNKASDTMICFTEVQFLQTYSLLRWSQRPGLFQPFPSLSNGHLDRVSFLLNQTGHLDPSQGPPHTWCLLLDYKSLENKNGNRRKHDCKSQATKATNNTLITLSQVANH
jgi:hypothetical protein